MTGALIKGEMWTQRNTQREDSQVKTRGRSEASTKQEKPNPASKPPGGGERKGRIISLQVSEGACMALPTLISDFRPLELGGNTFLLL